MVVKKKIRTHMARHQRHKYVLQRCLLAIFAIILVVSCHNVPDMSSSNPKHSSTVNCRVIQHAMGETCVPTNPQRVVVLDLLDSALALGVKPVGATTYDGKFRSYLLEQTRGIEQVGLVEQPNLESILRLQPDLILGINWHDAIYAQLSQIAPTVLAKGDREIDWKLWLRTYAKALGRTPVAEKLVDNYDKRVELFRQQMGRRLSQTQVSIVMSWDGYRTYMKRSFSGQILNDLGLSRPPLQDKEKVNEDISLELIPRMEGDVIFLAIGGNNPSNVGKLVNHPLWSQLKAVQQKRVYEVDADVWIAGYSPVAANVVLDDLFKYLINENR